MKLFRNILASVAAVFAVASCAITPEDTFSTAPVAPVMSAHNDILITTANVDEDVTFAWEKARFIDAAVYAYDLYVKFGENEALVAALQGRTAALKEKGVTLKDTPQGVQIIFD